MLSIHKQLALNKKSVIIFTRTHPAVIYKRAYQNHFIQIQANPHIHVQLWNCVSVIVSALLFEQAKK